MNYLGCWIDNPHDRILSEFYSNRRKGGLDWYNLGETILNCAKDAIDTGKQYKFFAVQFYGECWSEEGNPDYKKMKAAPHACKLGTYLRTVPTFVTAHAFCASGDTQVSHGWYLLIQGYFCAV